MNKDKVYIEGYEVGFRIDTLETREKIIRLVSGETVSIDENFIYKSIEQEKVKIPQFVADWYEENKDDFETSLFQCIYELFKKRNDSELNEFENWVIDENTKPFQTLVNMHQFGYEVEEEKRYLVKIKGVNEECEYLVFGELSNTWKLRSLGSFGELRKHHTCKELEEAGFGEIFNSPLFEVVEVE